MSSKKVPVPVRIGLTKKPANSASAVELENDISDLLSESTMDALDEIVQDVHEIQEDEDEDDGRFYELPELEDELDRDTDPDFVPPARPRPSTSTASKKGKSLLHKPQVLPKRSLNLLSKDTPEAESETSKGRSSAPIWKYFTVSDRKVGNHMQKGAVCIVDVGGVPCDKRIMQNLSSTTGLNQHLERKHPKEYTAYKLAQSTLQAERLSTKRTLMNHFEDLEVFRVILHIYNLYVL